MSDKPKRFDLFKVISWSAVGVMGVWLLMASFHPERRIVPFFTAEGRNETSKFLRYNFPTTAEWLGLNHAQTAKKNAPTMSWR